MRNALLPLVAVLTLTPLAPATAAPPGEGERPGRFVMQPVDGGFLRMDTETGAMSMCTRRSGAFVCEAVPDERATSKEVERLAGENRELKADVRRLEEQLRGGAPAPREERQAKRSPRFELPSEEEVDKAIGYIERMIKKFRDKLRDLEGGSGKSTPL